MSVGITISSLTEQADGDTLEGSGKLGGSTRITFKVEEFGSETLDTIEDFGREGETSTFGSM